MTADRKKPIFGTLSLTIMVGFFVAAVVMNALAPPPGPASGDETLATAIGAVANIVATLVAAGTLSISSAILALISFIRGEPRWPAAIGLCLALSCLVVLVIAVTNL